MSEIDWANVTKIAKAGADIPAGEYNLILVDAKGGVSSAGNHGLKLRFKVEDGDWKGATVLHTAYLILDHPSLVAQFLADLAVLGVSAQTLTQGGRNMPVEEIAARIMQEPRRVRAKTKVDEYAGRKSNKIDGGLMSATGSSSGAFSIAPPAVMPPAPAAPFAAPPTAAPVADNPPPF